MSGAIPIFNPRSSPLAALSVSRIGHPAPVSAAASSQAPSLLQQQQQQPPPQPMLVTPRDWPVPPYLSQSTFYPSFQVGGPPSTSGTTSSQNKTYIERLQEKIDDSGLCSLSEEGGEEKIRLPSRLDQKQCCKRLHITNDTRVQFLPERDEQGREKLNRHDPDKDAAAVRADHPMPPQAGIYYYEVEIISKGQKGYIGIGFSTRGVDLERLPGWNPESYGYHGDDGKIFQCSGTGSSYGPRFSSGDIIGCGIDFISQKAFFTKNGQWLGYAFDLHRAFTKYTSSTTTVEGEAGEGEEERPPGNPGTRREREWQKEKKARENKGPLKFYPTIGLQTVGENVKVNFGQEKFKFDIESFVKRQKQENTQRILQNPIPRSYTSALSHRPTSTFAPSSSTNTSETSPNNNNTNATDLELKSTMENLISGYLSHRGFTETSRAFRRQREIEKKDWSGLLRPSSTSISVDALVAQGVTSTSGSKSKIDGGEKKKKIKKSSKTSTVDAGMEGTSKTMKSAIRTTLDSGERSEVDQLHEEGPTPSTSTNSIPRRGEDAEMASSSGTGSIQDDLMMSDIPAASSSQSMQKTSSAEAIHDVEEAELRDTSLRQSICASLRSGDLDTAISDLEEHYPEVLKGVNNLGSLKGTMMPSSTREGKGKGKGKQRNVEDGMDILFRLRTRKFIELVLKSTDEGRDGSTNTEVEEMDMAVDEDDDKENEEVASSLIPSRNNSPTTSRSKQSVNTLAISAKDDPSSTIIEDVLSYGARLNALYPRSLSTPEVRRYLDLVFSLVAYEDPASEPGELGDLCKQERREEIAEVVNRAMLESKGRSGLANLELVYRQAYAVQDVLGRIFGDGRAALVGNVLEG